MTDSKNPLQEPEKHVPTTELVELRYLNVDPRSFRVPAKDTGGNSARCQFRLPPIYIRMIDILLQSRLFPYRTKGDVFRHAVIVLFDNLKRINHGIPSVSGAVDAMNMLLSDEEYASEFNQILSKLEDVISFHLKSEADGEIIRILLDMQQHINSMPDGYWKDKYTKELNARWGHRLKQAKRANLMDSLNEEDKKEDEERGENTNNKSKKG